MKTNKINWWKNLIDYQSKKSLTKYILNSKSFGEGKYTKLFEKNVCKIVGSKYGLCTTSGTSALMLSLYAIKVRPGDEIIMPNRGWIATAHAAYTLGAKPILVETTKNQIINTKKILEKITKKTKAIIPVHVNGQACDMKKIKEIAKIKRIKIIEDACQAFMSKHKKKYLGTYGDLGCYSFGTTKLLNNIQGGFVVTNNKKIYQNLKLIKNHGVYNNFTDKWNQPGFNFKYNDILSHLGNQNLKFIKKKIKNVEMVYYLYKKNLKNKNISFLNEKLSKGELPIYFLIFCKRKGLIKYMKKKNIEIRPLPPSISESKYINQNNNSLSRLDKFFKNCYYLPSGPDITSKEIKKVCKIINMFK